MSSCRTRCLSRLVVRAVPTRGAAVVAFFRCSWLTVILALVLVLLNHWIWFRHFSEHQQRAYRDISSYYDTPETPSFTEIASYFGLCVWLVPFALFVSLSASDNVLPTMGSEAPSMAGGSKKKSQGMAKAVVDSVLSAIGEIGAIAGWKKLEDRL